MMLFISHTCTRFWHHHPLQSQISKQSLHPEPIFILGAYRSGTTHLHNLLAQDPAFAYVTAYNAGGYTTNV